MASAPSPCRPTPSPHRDRSVGGKKPTATGARRGKSKAKSNRLTTREDRQLLSNLPDQLPVSRAEVEIVNRYFSDLIIAVLKADNEN
jgi:hypothetical protein